MSNFLAIHHGSFIVSDTDRSLQFYCEILGMQRVPRADLPFPGAWLGIGEQQLHLLELPNPDPADDRPAHGGRDRHLAIMVARLALVRDALEEAGLGYTMSRSGRPALFCRDPDGNTLEIIESSAGS